MAEVKKIERVVELVEREVSPVGYEVFLSQAEMDGLRQLLGLGMTSRTQRKLGLEDLFNKVYSAGKIDYSLRFEKMAKLETEWD